MTEPTTTTPRPLDELARYVTALAGELPPAARRAVSGVTPDGETGEVDPAELARTWRELKMATKTIFEAADVVKAKLQRDHPTSRGWHFDTGLPVIQTSRFETDVLNEAEAAAWLAGQDDLDAKIVHEAKLNDHAKKLVRKHVDAGGTVPGVSAGRGRPYLMLPRGSR